MARRFYFLKAKSRRENLPQQLRAMGAEVDEVVVYQTIIPEPENLERIQQLLKNGTIDIATFFSPSSILNFAELIGVEYLANTTIATIGSTTAEAVAQLGLNVAILAKQATTKGLVEAIEEHLKT